MKSKNTASPESKSTQQTSAVWGWLMRFVSTFHFKFWCWMTLIVGGFCFFCWCVSQAIGSIADEAKGWIARIEDPTERGCAYIALSILVMTFVVAVKSFSSEKIEITTKD